MSALLQVVQKRVEAFMHALRGAASLVRTQTHAKFHLLATIGVTSLAFYLRISLSDWIPLVFAFALVWTAEALNTAVEFLADEVSLERRGRIKLAKDIAAFGVLAACLASTIVGVIIFVPYLSE